MAKQIYIDENGNENLVSGTINTGKMLPMSTTEPTSMVADRIEALETAISGKAQYKTVDLSFTSSNDGTYLVPTNEIALTERPLIAYVDSGLVNYSFNISNYRGTNWLLWCRNAGTWALVTNTALTVKVVVLY